MSIFCIVGLRPTVPASEVNLRRAAHAALFQLTALEIFLMKRFGFCFLVFVLAILLLPEPAGSEDAYYPLVLEADAAYADQRWDSAVALYRKAFLVREPRELDLYNGACCAALAGDLRTAREWLGSAVNHGWYDVDWMNQDSDLASLRAAPEWEAILLDLENRREVYEASLDIQLRAELKSILNDDQAGRNQFGATLREYGPDSAEVDALKKKINEADQRNLERVLGIIEEHGWPGASLVGSDGSQAAFLVVQHAPLDIQERLLPMMRQAVAEQELEPADLALLEDRVRTRNGQPQVYGTQVQCDPKTWKDCFVQPIENEANVNARREQVGLGPLELYLKQWSIEWEPPLRGSVH